jgi:hypothetical protein
VKTAQNGAVPRHFADMTVCGIWQWNGRSCFLSPEAFVDVSFFDAVLVLAQATPLRNHRGLYTPSRPGGTLFIVLAMMLG